MPVTVLGSSKYRSWELTDQSSPKGELLHESKAKDGLTSFSVPGRMGTPIHSCVTHTQTRKWWLGETRAVKLWVNKKRRLFLGSDGEGEILIVEIRGSLEGEEQAANPRFQEEKSLDLEYCQR